MIVVDIGGTHVRIAKVALRRMPKIHARDERIIPTSVCDPKRFIDEIRAYADRADGMIEGIGISMAGLVDPERGIIRASSPNLPDSWRRFDLVSKLRRKFHCPVRMCNDAVAAAIGEVIYGKTREDFVLLAWGTGIGGAAITQRNGMCIASSFEPGRMQIPSGNDLREWEDRCGGIGMQRRFKKNPTKLSSSEWKLIQADMTVALQNLIALHPTKTLVLSGGIGIHQQRMIRMIQKELNRHASSTISDLRTIRIATYRERVGLYGALALMDSNVSLILL